MRSKQRFLDDEDDPLTRAMAPPPNETIQERDARIRKEQEAKKVSDEIDAELNKDLKNGTKVVKILLLGQSESGKSTTLKNFQLINTPKAFHAERASWRAVVQYNITRSMRVIMEAMDKAEAASQDTGTRKPNFPPLTSEHLKLKTRLSPPLTQAEQTLIRKLTLSSSPQFADGKISEVQRIQLAKEVFVNATTQWKSVFGRLLKDGRKSSDPEHMIDWDDPEDPGVVLHACADDMKRLWNDPIIQKLLEMQNLRIEEVAGFFLDSLDRVTARKYIPSDNDILRARLKTVGVTEYCFTPKDFSSMFGGSIASEWKIYDVGGQRSLRAAWVPFFDDMNAIIFLAAISCFDQVLAEDPSVNRIEDSVLLWKSVVSNPLLKRTNLVLFLNKCDILKAKLASGKKFGEYIVSFGDRPNDFESASHYLRKKFAAIQKDHSPEPRPFYCHFTSVTDTKSTQIILTNVQDMILRDNLKKSSLMS